MVRLLSTSTHVKLFLNGMHAEGQGQLEIQVILAHQYRQEVEQSLKLFYFLDLYKKEKRMN